MFYTLTVATDKHQQNLTHFANLLNLEANKWLQLHLSDSRAQIIFHIHTH